MSFCERVQEGWGRLKRRKAQTCLYARAPKQQPNERRDGCGWLVRRQDAII